MLNSEQVSIIIITIVMIIGIFYFRSQLQKAEEGKPLHKGLVALIELIQYLHEFTIESMGEYHGKRMSAYIGSVFIYLFIANISGLFGLDTPTTNLSVTLALSLISWILIQAASIKTNGIGGYLKGFFDPFFLFFPMNIMGELSTLLSLAMRLFGNLIAGSVIMSLLYTFGAWLSSMIPILGDFNFIGPIIASVFHLYFDVFSGFIQAFIFMSLTTIFIGVEFQGDTDMDEQEA